MLIQRLARGASARTRSKALALERQRQRDMAFQLDSLRQRLKAGNLRAHPTSPPFSHPISIHTQTLTNSRIYSLTDMIISVCPSEEDARAEMEVKLAAQAEAVKEAAAAEAAAAERRVAAEAAEKEARAADLQRDAEALRKENEALRKENEDLREASKVCLHA